MVTGYMGSNTIRCGGDSLDTQQVVEHEAVVVSANSCTIKNKTKTPNHHIPRKEENEQGYSIVLANK